MAEHRGGSGNFAENREKHLKRAAKAVSIAAEFQNDPQRASEAGKKVVRIVTADVNPIIPDLL